jgi:hypothetical protein
MTDPLPTLEGLVRARDRTLARISTRAQELFPLLPARSPAQLDYDDLLADPYLGTAALLLPWHQWELALGRLRPRGLRPLAWLRFLGYVRAAKRDIQRAHDRRFISTARRLAHGG